MNKDEDDTKNLPIPDKGSEGSGDRSVSGNKQDLEAPQPQLVAREIMSSFIAQSGPRYHPIFDKFEPEHVSLFLKNSHENQMRIRHQESSNRNYALIVFLVIVGFLVFLAIFVLQDNVEIFVDFLKTGGVLVIGSFGGFGIGLYRLTKSRERE